MDADINDFVKNLNELTGRLTAERKGRFYDLLDQFIFKLNNSESFKQRCCRQIDQGLNPLHIYLEKNKFTL
jgi:hypothetical protein